MVRRTFHGTEPGFWQIFKPKPTEVITRETETSSNVGSGSIPQAAVGMPVVAVLGRKRVPDVNTIWTGNLRPLTETTTTTEETKELVDKGGGITEEIVTTKTVTTITIIGYLVDIHLGVCLGPDVHLLAIYVDNKRVWNGDVGPARSTITLPKNDTFISESSVVFSGGAFNQAPEPDIAVADYPGYVGIATVLLKNVRADLPMGNLSFEVLRIPNPLGLSGANNRSGDDLNVMSAAAEVMTNEWGYGGLDIANLDVASMSAQAIILKNESNFCSVKIGSETSVAAVLKALQDQADMIIFQSPVDGLITTSLIRNGKIDYITNPRFNPSNVEAVQSYSKGGWPDTIDQARGLYTERDADYNEVPVFMQNVANVSRSGRGKRTATITYPYVPNKTLTRVLLARDIAMLSAPNYGYNLLTNRDGAYVLPGDVIIVTWPKLDLLNVPMLVLKIRKQELNNNKVVIQCRQMVFPDTNALFGEAVDGYDPGFDLGPKTPTAVHFETAPYYMARARAGISSAQTNPVVYPVVLPAPANNLQFSFSAIIENIPNTPGDTQIIGSGGYPTFGNLASTIGIYDDTDDGIIAGINLSDVLNPINLINIGNGGVRGGQLFMFVGNEIMSFESVTDNGGGSWTLNNVHRGLLDTVAEAHSIGDDCYIINSNFNCIPGSGFAYPLGYTPDWVIISNVLNENGVKADGLSSSGWSPSFDRTLLPLRPHNTKINSHLRSTIPNISAGDSITVTWFTRSRAGADVKLQLDSAESPEINGAVTQSHRVFILDSAAVLHDCGTSTSNSKTFTVPTLALGSAYLYVQAEGALGNSHFQDRVRFTVPSAFRALTEDSFNTLTEDGFNVLTEE